MTTNPRTVHSFYFIFLFFLKPTGPHLLWIVLGVIVHPQPAEVPPDRKLDVLHDLVPPLQLLPPQPLRLLLLLQPLDRLGRPGQDPPVRLGQLPLCRAKSDFR